MSQLAHYQDSQLSLAGSLVTFSLILTSTFEVACLRGTTTNRQCSCDLVGSQSPICDKFSGHCLCKPGFAGPRCNQCPKGFHKLNETLEQTNSTAHPKWTCAPCDICYTSWSAKVDALKESSINAIKSAHDTVSKLDHEFRILADKNNRCAAGEDSCAQTVVDFDDLERKLTLVGEKVIENKQNSDRLDTLAYELNATRTQLSDQKFEYTAQKSLETVIRNKTLQLEMTVYLQRIIWRDLDSAIRGLEREQNDIQMYLPNGAVRLIDNNINKTRGIMSDVFEFKRTLLEQRSFNFSNDQFAPRELALTDTQQASESTLRMYREVMVSLNITQPLGDQNESSCKPVVPQDNSINGEAIALDKLAVLLSDLAAQNLDNYQAQSEYRTPELENARLSREETRQVINLTNDKLDKFVANISSMMEEMTSHVHQAGGQMIQHTIQMVRTSLDKIEAKTNTAKSELGDLFRDQQSSGSMEQVGKLCDSIVNMTSENKLANKLPNEFLPDGSEIEGLKNLTVRVKNLTSGLRGLDRNLTEFTRARQVVQGTHTSVREINAASFNDDAAPSIDQIFGTRARRQAAYEPVLDSLRDLDTQLESKSDALRRVQTNTIGDKVMQEYKLQKQMAILETERALSNHQLKLLNEKHRFAKRILSALIETGPSNTDDALMSKLSDRRRLVNLTREFKSIALMLHKNLSATRNISAEMVDYTNQFKRQKKILDFLHNELDSANNDLKKYIEQQASC